MMARRWFTKAAKEEYREEGEKMHKRKKGSIMKNSLRVSGQKTVMP
jgi:hypothetical protein